MKEIVVNQGKRILVDDSDYDWLMQWTWTAVEHHSGCWYACRCEKGKKCFMHREIMQTPKGSKTDHIDGNGLNNQRSNLRICTTAQNIQNQKIRVQEKSSVYKGVSWSIGFAKWGADIRVNGKHVYLGRFDSEIDAAKEYDKAATLYFGEFARTNFEVDKSLPWNWARKIRKKTSQFRGVHWQTSVHKWHAEIRSKGVYRFLGLFTSEIEAAKAYNAAAIELHKELAQLNDIPPIDNLPTMW